MFTHLHLHTEYSLLDGYGSPDNYAEYAKELGFSSLGITDHGNIDGVLKFQKSCKVNNITPVFGCELYIVPDIECKEKGEKRYHICTFIKSEKGWQNLNKILNIANSEKGFFKRPRVSPKHLLEHQEGLIISSACSSSFINGDLGEDMFVAFRESFKEDLYLEVMPFLYKDQIQTNRKILEFHQKYGTKIIATNDCHYPRAVDNKVQEVLLAIQSKARWKDSNRWKFDVQDLFLKTERQMYNTFVQQGVLSGKQIQDSLNNTSDIVLKCKDFEIKKRDVCLPSIPQCKNRDEERFLNLLLRQGFKKLVEDKNLDVTSYRIRLEEEKALIYKLKYQRYFLIVWELVNWCKNNNIMVGPGRGSVGGSLFAYLLGITQVDPIKYNLVFSRFISPARIDLPDIDMDFEDRKRPLVIQHLKDIYGENCVCGISTFLSMKGKGALRDVSRVFEIPIFEVNKAAAAIVERSSGDMRSSFCIKDAFEVFEEGKIFAEKYPEVTELAIKLEGAIKSCGRHAAGTCITDSPIQNGERGYLCQRNDSAVINWEKSDAEYLGLMKLDILGLSALTVLSEALSLIKENHNKTIVLEDINLDDKKVYKEIAEGHTIGAFQIGSQGLSRYCKELHVDNFGELVHATSLWRPGTLRSGMCSNFIQRKFGREKFTYLHPILEQLTKDTYGIILYQEQVMQFMYDLAGLPWKTCDTVRKVISKSQGDEQFKAFKELFIKGCEEKKTLSKDIASKFWEELSNFGSYGFNRSHAVEYSLITYWDMFLKTYFPAEFMAASLTYCSDEKKEDLIKESYRLGLEIKFPKIERSHQNRWLVSDKNNLCVPFSSIKGIGDKASDKIESFKRKEISKLPPTINRLLTEIKALDSEELNSEQLERIAKYFDWDITRNPLGEFKRVFPKIDKSFTFLKTINFDKPSKDIKYLYGKIKDLRFGYRQNITKVKNSSLGLKDSMGGVYGFFQDGLGDSVMLIFDGELYNKKKTLIEHCEDKLLVIKYSHPNKMTNILCHDIITEEELKDLEISNFEDIFIPKRIDRKLIPVQSCNLCKYNSVQKLVPNRVSDIMVLFEHNYDYEKYSPLVKKELIKRRVNPELISFSSVMKCSYRDEKLDKNCYNKCSVWLKKEIFSSETMLVLAFGNMSLRFFLDQESGIIDKSGTFDFIKKYGLWSFWSISPSMLKHSTNNEILFSKSIDLFSSKINKLIRK